MGRVDLISGQFPHFRSPDASDLDRFVQALAESEFVEAVFLLGTSAADLRPESDLDLGIVLADMPVPLHVGLTEVGDRLADLLFVTIEEIEAAATGLGQATRTSESSLAQRLLREGTVAFDRGGRVEKLSERWKVQQSENHGRPESIHSHWFRINYNLRHNRRMLDSEDPIYKRALQLRLLYSLFETVLGYVHFRGLRWKGEKHAVHYLERNDPEFHGTLIQALESPDMHQKFHLYEDLARRSTEPVGGLAPRGTTILEYSGPIEVNPQIVEETQKFWDSLIGA